MQDEQVTNNTEKSVFSSNNNPGISFEIRELIFYVIRINFGNIYFIMFEYSSPWCILS